MPLGERSKDSTLAHLNISSTPLSLLFTEDSLVKKSHPLSTALFQPIVAYHEPR
jgi:hypothetical protein